MSRTVTKLIVVLMSSCIYALSAYGYGIEGGSEKGVLTTKHNMFKGLMIEDKQNNMEPCLWCHIPHDKYVGKTAPKWNQDSGQNFTIYGAQDESDYDYANRPDTILRVCLTCHDGINAPNIVLSNNEESQKHTKEANLLGQPVTYDSHQHPVGRDYAPHSVNGRKASLKPQSTPLLGWIGADSIGDLVPEGVIRCTSCHDPHSTSGLFLRINNSQSQLCLGCHGK